MKKYDFMDVCEWADYRVARRRFVWTEGKYLVSFRFQLHGEKDF